MKVLFEDLAKECLLDIYYYNSSTSLKLANEIDISIRSYIRHLENLPYIGKHIEEIENTNFRALYLRKHNLFKLFVYNLPSNKY